MIGIAHYFQNKYYNEKRDYATYGSCGVLENFVNKQYGVALRSPYGKIIKEKILDEKLTPFFHKRRGKKLPSKEEIDAVLKVLK